MCTISGMNTVAPQTPVNEQILGVYEFFVSLAYAMYQSIRMFINVVKVMFKNVVRSLNTTQVNNLSLAFQDKKQSIGIK